MHDFHYRGKELYCEDTSLARIADAVGTPAYVYSHHTLVDHYRKLDAAFAPVDHLICYSVKANSNIAVLRALAREGAGMDIVSEGELHRAQAAGVDPGKIVFAGVGKSSAEIEAALSAGILCFTVESDAELVDECREHHRRCILGDGLQHLRQRAIVSAPWPLRPAARTSEAMTSMNATKPSAASVHRAVSGMRPVW